ncbi:hypothetical protein RAY_40 [Erwinia phage vB_EamM_RAY]|uniref:Uncharacterized protein n=4 Tax=Agricanvirus TaxID=1984776 RepID=A0A173GDP7_9CAUD|nr:hypothetical protein FDH97_gp041 [Erwinia phage vB_EamM_Deimos-Minion]YP_009605507.1 hypothetical protein FDH98_gp040 [Erwinia phage vB_EamM_RAY]YP_009605825.1 hypothetical protein FDH99_gp041 [Erwinia phage vB_EamM_Simmy50]YP_009606146.1 hypothetical protein FDI00_gp040 [Erwinia phage vB_EamM_Special G]ANH51503.1 hypothetical protein SIMMY50_41 [Erwinia phage vB_EamM_Simmy50]ANH51821.1 hypothetical protein RAY_40 [Erwinia phage vB_EamM_RAY]ANH52139.1 hypothetical protein DM_41 [Erwinia ph
MSLICVDHLVAACATFVLLLVLERIIHRDEPDHTLIELLLTAFGISISIPITVGMIMLTYVILLIRKQPNALTRASYFPVEILRLITRNRFRRKPSIL